jgi:hypothetical protein
MIKWFFSRNGILRRTMLQQTNEQINIFSQRGLLVATVLSKMVAFLFFEMRA